MMLRRRPLAVLAALLLALMPTGSSAFPTLYNSCCVPSRGYGFHEMPLQDSGATLITRVRNTGEVTSVYAPGETYTITVTFPEYSRGIVMASTGVLSGDNAVSNPPSCDNFYLTDSGCSFASRGAVRAIFASSQTAFVADWTAPLDGAEPVYFNVVRASKFNSPYYLSGTSMTSTTSKNGV